MHIYIYVYICLCVCMYLINWSTLFLDMLGLYNTYVYIHTYIYIRVIQYMHTHTHIYIYSIYMHIINVCVDLLHIVGLSNFLPWQSWGSNTLGGRASTKGQRREWHWVKAWQANTKVFLWFPPKILSNAAFNSDFVIHLHTAFSSGVCRADGIGNTRLFCHMNYFLGSTEMVRSQKLLHQSFKNIGGEWGWEVAL